MPHEPATCLDLFCLRCDDYGTGYSRGKEKAVQEMLDRVNGPPHARGCGCAPCKVYLHFLEEVLTSFESALR